jgi:hypothetical protein
VRFLTGMTLLIKDDRRQSEADQPPKKTGWLCPCCGRVMRVVASYPRRFDCRPPPPPDST